MIACVEYFFHLSIIKDSSLSIGTLRRKRVSSCGETGDLYAWNVDDWKEEDGAPITSISKKILSNVCNNNEDIFLPFLTVRSEKRVHCDYLDGVC